MLDLNVLFNFSLIRIKRKSNRIMHSNDLTVNTLNNTKFELTKTYEEESHCKRKLRAIAPNTSDARNFR